MGKIDEIAALAARLGEQAPESKYIRAYHGSPYDFDKFDASKIGTGEGAASHGHGFYMTKSGELAEYYRPTGGRVYELEIPGNKETLLDWNVPVIQQSTGIQGAVRELLNSDALHLKGGKAYDLISRNYGDGLSDERVSQLLFDRGIVGNTFLGARQGDAGRARNYVVFPGAEDQIRILRKFAVPGAIGAGAAGGMQDQQ